MEAIMERKGNKVFAEGMTATIPSTISMIAVFGRNGFIQGGKYSEDGWIYVNGKPVKKWFRNVENISIWFPILEDVHNLQKRYDAAKKRYKGYADKVWRPAFDKVMKVGRAHARVTHKFEGEGIDPWWLYEANKYSSQKGICWDWVKKPVKPINIRIGNAYYRASQRLEDLGGRSYKFRIVLEHALSMKVGVIEGAEGQILQYKVGNRSYWYKKGQFRWEKLAFPDDNALVREA